MNLEALTPAQLADPTLFRTWLAEMRLGDGMTDDAIGEEVDQVYRARLMADHIQTEMEDVRNSVHIDQMDEMGDILNGEMEAMEADLYPQGRKNSAFSTTSSEDDSHQELYARVRKTSTTGANLHLPDSFFGMRDEALQNQVEQREELPVVVDSASASAPTESPAVFVAEKATQERGPPPPSAMTHHN
jgi:hypothetical protein